MTTESAETIRDEREYLVTMRDEAGGEQETFIYVPSGIESEQDAQAILLATVDVEDWVRGGDWGADGWRAIAYYSLEDGDSTWREVRVEVEIDPDHASLISAAMGEDEGCGNNPDDHSWSSEGESGLVEHPGVWGVGGTGMVFNDHCQTCGLRREVFDRGSQREPGEADSIRYQAPAAATAEATRECREYTVSMSDESGGEGDRTTFYVPEGTEAEQDAEARRLAVLFVEGWVRVGDDAGVGGTVVAYYTLSDEDSAWAEVRLEVQIVPDSD